MGCQPLIKYCQTPKDFPLKKIRMSYNKPGKIIQFRKWSICCVYISIHQSLEVALTRNSHLGLPSFLKNLGLG